MRHGTWVVVADGKKALFLHNQGDDDLVDLRVLSVDEQDNPPTREQASDRPGRLADPGHGRSAVETTDWHQLEEDRFARSVAERLNKAALADHYQRLILVAPPRALGELRQHLHKETQARLIGEIDKDLTGHPVHVMEKLIANHQRGG